MDLSIAGLVGEAVHHCADDVYATAYVFADEGWFSIRHDVRGPRKDYDIATRYTRRDG